MTRVMSNHVSVCLEMVLVSVQGRCTVCARRTIGSEIISDTTDGTPRRRGSETVLDAPMVLLGDEAQGQGRFGVFRDSGSLDARDVRGLRRTNHRLRNRFGRT